MEINLDDLDSFALSTQTFSCINILLSTPEQQRASPYKLHILESGRRRDGLELLVVSARAAIYPHFQAFCQAFSDWV